MSSFPERLKAVLAIPDEARRARAFLKLQYDVTEHLYLTAGIEVKRTPVVYGLVGH